MNHAYCNRCDVLVPARHVEHDGKVFLTKDCPECGETETIVSSNAKGYWAKRKMDEDFQYGHCKMSCLSCQHKEPNIVFVDITNRCNLNCPICINNTPAMGFLFEPPIEYFDTIFKHFASRGGRPSIQLFGGEPTVRKDLLDIIKLARSYRMPTRVVTNGLRLADEEYCRKIVESKVTILLSYDGDDLEMHKVLRNSEKAVSQKHQALDNIGKIGGGKVVLMTLVANGFNDQQLPDIFKYCHEKRDFVRGIYLMPLAHTWDKETFDLKSERTTTEDLEKVIDDAFPEDKVEFLPSNILGRLPTLSRYLGVKALPFVGGHPNCESMYLLVSNGERYLPVTHYLKSSVPKVAQDLLAAEDRLAKREAVLGTSAWGRFLAKFKLRSRYLSLCAVKAVGKAVLGNIRVGRALAGRGPTAWVHASLLLAGLALRRKSERLLRKHTRVRSVLQIIVLPFGDKENMETDRLQRCPAAFAYVDPKDGKVKHVPNCAWGMHKDEVLRGITDHYASLSEQESTARPEPAPDMPAPVPD